MDDAKAILLGFICVLLSFKEPSGRAVTMSLTHGYEGDGMNQETVGHTEVATF